MSYWQEGYDKGYADGSAGELSGQWQPMIANMLNTEDMTEWEEGYLEGYENGKEEYDSRQDT